MVFCCTSSCRNKLVQVYKKSNLILTFQATIVYVFGLRLLLTFVDVNADTGRLEVGLLVVGVPDEDHGGGRSTATGCALICRDHLHNRDTLS